MFRECSAPGNNQFETLEKDFFFRRGGWGAWRTSGRGGGGGRARSIRLGGVGGVDGVLNAADASVNDFNRVGMCTVLDGAVLGLWSARGSTVRSMKVGLMRGMGSGKN